MYIALNPPSAKLLIASTGVSTRGSPAELKLVFRIMPSPVSSLKALINSYHVIFSSLLTVYFKKPYICEKSCENCLCNVWNRFSWWC